jgi:hypothetical protein
MLNKYKFITIMKGEFCKIIILETCVSNQSFIFMKRNKNQHSFGLILKHLQSSNAFQFPTMCNGCHHTILDVFRRLTFISDKLTKRGVNYC